MGRVIEMKAAAHSEWKPTALQLQQGICRFCGCTYERACRDGCVWVDFHQTVCSTEQCVERYVTEFAADLRRLTSIQHTAGKDVYL